MTRNAQSGSLSRRGIAGVVPVEGRIYPVPVKPPSRITGWETWPSDVVPTLRRWNQGRGLSFYSVSGVFRCPDCLEFCRQPLAAHLKDVPHCDDCMIVRARAVATERTEENTDG